jgi:hypothetical protein
MMLETDARRQQYNIAAGFHARRSFCFEKKIAGFGCDPAQVGG